MGKWIFQNKKYHWIWSSSTLKLSGNITVNNAPKFDEELIEYFAHTRFKTHQISAAIVTEVENGWLMVVFLFFWVLGSSFLSSDAFLFDSLDASGKKD